MYTPKIIKPYAQPFILAILIALLLCNCRSASQHSSMRVSEQADSVSVRLSGNAHGNITSQAQTQTDINGNKWKITWHFDTSQPADPTTGLPPTSKLEVEGSEIRKQIENRENVSSETSDSVSYQKTDTGFSNEYTQQESQKQTESGTDIERSIAIGIILLSIIIGIILYVRSHSPK